MDFFSIMASTKNWVFIFFKKSMGQMPTNAKQQDVTKVISVWPPCALYFPDQKGTGNPRKARSNQRKG